MNRLLFTPDVYQYVYHIIDFDRDDMTNISRI